MTKQILFFQGGGGQADHEADSRLVESLVKGLGPDYHIRYPVLENGESPDLGRRKQIGRELAASTDNILLVGHSLGASMLLVYLTEYPVEFSIGGIFLLATPFWNDNEDWAKPFTLRPDFARQLDRKVPLYFYHCSDDEEVPVSHLADYKRHLPWGSFRELPVGGHQFTEGLEIVATDIKSIAY